VKIEINHTLTLKEPWGRLSIEDAAAASSVLSGAAFKKWVELALNQDAYIWTGELDRSVKDQLITHNYLFSLDNGDYVFESGGNAAEMDVSESWKQIVELYGSGNSKRDYRYVYDKLGTMALENKTDEVLTYWANKYTDLQGIDHSKIKNRLKYDLSIILVWWVRDFFRFRAGDVLQVGTDGNRLRYHDDALKAKIANGVRQRGVNCIHMTNAAAETWNKWLSAGLFEFRQLQDVGDILRSREDQKTDN